MFGPAFILFSLSCVPQLTAGDTKPTFLIYTMPHCVWCDKMKETLGDPKVQVALAGHQVGLVAMGPGVPRYAMYPHVVMEWGEKKTKFAFDGYKSPEQLLAWIATLRTKDLD